VGHAVDGLAALVLGHRSAFGVRLVLEPVRQAIAAEAREVHQVDVLDIGAAAQMFDERRNTAASSSVLVLSSIAMIVISQLCAGH